MAKWFLCSHEEVRGPLATEELRSAITNGAIDSTSLVWGRPNDQWMNLQQWLKYIAEAPVPTIDSRQEERQWHYAIAGNSKGPYKRSQLIDELKHLPTLEGVLLWTKGMKAWSSLFEFYDIADELDVNRRQFPRSTLDGKIIARMGDFSHEGTLASLSEGGFGARGLDSLIPGERYQVEIHSQELGEPIHVTAELRYLSDDSYTGFKFENLTAEARSQIVQAQKRMNPLRRAA